MDLSLRNLNLMLKMDPSLRTLKDELLLGIILYGSDIMTLLTRKYFFIQLPLSKIPSASKDHYLATNLLLLLFYYIFYFYYIHFFLGKFNLKHCLLPITSFLGCLFINLTF